MKLKSQSCTVSDRMELTSRTITDEGFLVAPATIARTGVQVYRAGELGIGRDSGMDPNTLIRMHRPAEEVFDPESVRSFQNRPMTLGHPKGNRVDAKNWRAVSVGDMANVAGDGATLNGVTTVRDAGAVQAVVDGKKYLSAGYSFELDPTPGTAADGQEYDAVMRKIRGNHVAIVDSPRGGPVCRIADSIQHGEKTMRKFVVDGISIEVEDSTTADLFAKLQSERDTANQKIAAKIKVGDKEFIIGDAGAIQTAVDAVAKENTELKAARVTPEQIEKQVSARVTLVGDALKLAPTMVVDGKTDVQIQREVISSVSASNENAKTVVDAVLGGVAVDAAEPTLLAIAFRTLTAAAPKTTAHAQTAADAALSAALVGDGKGGTTDNKVGGRDAFNERNNNAWQNSQK
jgi:hypothetical protein